MISDAEYTQKYLKYKNKYIELKKYAEQIGLGDALENYRCIVNPEAVGTIGEGENENYVQVNKDISQEELNLIKKKENEIKELEMYKKIRKIKIKLYN